MIILLSAEGIYGIGYWTLIGGNIILILENVEARGVYCSNSIRPVKSTIIEHHRSCSIMLEQ